MSALLARERLIRKIEEAFGPALCQTLNDPQVTDIMLNPDGRLFVERLKGGMEPAGTVPASRAEVLIGTVAHALGQEINASRPIVSGEIPLGGHRFEGLLPPAVMAPVFSIRRRAVHRIPLDAYVATGAMSAVHHKRILKAIERRLNILVCGGTGSGKTTLANALMHEIHRQFPDHRILLIEDTVEIECAAENAVLLRSSEDLPIARLLKSALRLRPDRIMVGEVRDGAALTLLKAWNTGHQGGFATVHANNAASALIRLEQLISEVSQSPMQQVIADAIDLVVSIRRHEHGRSVEEVLHVEGFDGGVYHFA